MVECVGSDVVEMSRVGRLSSLGKLTEILKNIILSMGPYPRTYVTIYGSHHAFLGLLNGYFEALCLAVTGHRGRSMAYGAVRVHPDEGLAHLGISG